MVFQGSLMDVSMKFQECFKEVIEVCGNFEGVSMNF